MKSKALLLFVGFIGLSFFYGPTEWANYNALALVVNTPVNNSYTFKANDMTWLETNLLKYPNQNARADAFFNTGDGGFFLGTYTDFQNNFSYNYHLSGSITPSLEVTPKYDDPDKPPKRVAGNPMTPTVSTAANQAVNLNGKSILLQASRQPSPSDEVTYIISFEKSNSVGGSIALTFDKTLFENTPVVQSKAYKIGETTSNISGPTLTPSGLSKTVLTWDYANTNWTVGDKGTIIVTLKTKSDTTLIGQTQTVTARNTFETTKDNDAITQWVVKSHDPNFKIVKPTLLPSTTQRLNYTIHFQNDGVGECSHVRIHDVFDRELLPNTIQITGWNPKHPKPTIENATNGPCHALDFVFNDLHLKGLAQQGCGTAFPISDTEGWVSFSIEIDRTKVKPCSAILNEADIYFDSNPAVHTTQAVCKIPCSGDTTSCQKVGDNFLPNHNLTLGQSTAIDFGNQIPTNFTDIKWYPCEGIDASNPRQPTFFSNSSTRYTCVASDPANCKQLFLHQNIEVGTVPQNPSQGSDSGSSPIGWICAAIAALLAILFAFFRKKKKPEPPHQSQKGSY